MCAVWERWSRRAKARYAKRILRAIEARWDREH